MKKLTLTFLLIFGFFLSGCGDDDRHDRHDKYDRHDGHDRPSKRIPSDLGIPLDLVDQGLQGSSQNADNSEDQQSGTQQSEQNQESQQTQDTLESKGCTTEENVRFYVENLEDLNKLNAEILDIIDLRDASWWKRITSTIYTNYSWEVRLFVDNDNGERVQRNFFIKKNSPTCSGNFIPRS